MVGTTLLDPSVEDVALLSPLLRPYDPAKMNCHEVSTIVNSPANNTPENIIAA
jgi:putative SOS response-associated peptidase YedK